MIWIVLLAMIFLGFVFLAYFVFKPLKHQEKSAKQSNTEIAQEKIAQLAIDMNDGQLDQSFLTQAKYDIASDLSQELTQNNHTTPINSHSISQTQLLSGVFLLILLLTSGIYLMIGQTNITAKLTSFDSVRTFEELEQFVEKNPTHQEAIKILAYSYFSNNNLKKSAQYYHQVYTIDKTDIEVIVEYASVLAAMQNNSFAGQPAQLIKEALSIDDTHMSALYLAGLAAYQQGQFSLTKKSWQRALAQAKPNSKDYASIFEQLQILSNETNQTIATITQKQTAKIMPKIMVSVGIDSAIKKKINPDDFVLIYAKSIQGMPAPLAIIKKQVKDLPIKVKLSDNDAMIAGHNLTNAKIIQVIARISQSGQAIKQAGDIEIKSEVIDLEKTPTPTIQLLIK